MPVNVLQWLAYIGNFYKYTHPLIKVTCSSLFNLDFDNSKGYIAVLYRSPSPTSSVFNYLLSNFEMLKEINASKLDFSIILGDFTVRSKS